jgi:hypothetical protein
LLPWHGSTPSGLPAGISASAVMACGRLDTRGPTHSGIVWVPGRKTYWVRGSARRAKTAQYLAMRAKIVLASAEGETDKQVAAGLSGGQPAHC